MTVCTFVTACHRFVPRTGAFVREFVGKNYITYIEPNNFVASPQKIVPFFEMIWEKYDISGQTTDNKMTHTHRTLDN